MTCSGNLRIRFGSNPEALQHIATQILQASVTTKPNARQHGMKQTKDKTNVIFKKANNTIFAANYYLNLNHHLHTIICTIKHA